MWASRAAGRRGQGRVPAHSSACGGRSTHPGGAGGRADLNPIHPPTRETGGADPAAEAKPRPGRQECGLPLPPRLAPVCHRLPDAGATGGRGTGRDSAPVSLPPAPPLNARFPIHRGRADAQAGPTPRCAPLPPRTGNPTARLLLEQSGRRLLEWPFTAEENPSPRSQH